MVLNEDAASLFHKAARGSREIYLTIKMFSLEFTIEPKHSQGLQIKQYHLDDPEDWNLWRPDMPDELRRANAKPEKLEDPLLLQIHTFADAYVITRGSQIYREKVTPALLAQSAVLLHREVEGEDVYVLQRGFNEQCIILVPKDVEMTLQIRRAIVGEGKEGNILPRWCQMALLTKNHEWST